MDREGAHVDKCWKVSQVAQLIGLSRRDIQRACYRGKGGVGILDPQDSTWGRRSYGPEDLARLYVVSIYKAQGLSLPEISVAFEQAQGNYRAILCQQVAQLRERRDNVDCQLARAEALLSATTPGASISAVSHLQLDISPLPALIEQLALRCMMRSGAPATLISRTSGGRLTTLLKRLAECKGHIAPEAEQPQEVARELVEQVQMPDAGPDARNQAVLLLSAVLDEPGIDLAIELWLEPGAHAYLCDAIGAFAEQAATP